MRKWKFFVIVISILMLVVSGCGGSSTPEKSSPEITIERPIVFDDGFIELGATVTNLNDMSPPDCLILQFFVDENPSWTEKASEFAIWQHYYSSYWVAEYGNLSQDKNEFDNVLCISNRDGGEIVYRGSMGHDPSAFNSVDEWFDVGMCPFNFVLTVTGIGEPQTEHFECNVSDIHHAFTAENDADENPDNEYPVENEEIVADPNSNINEQPPVAVCENPNPCTDNYGEIAYLSFQGITQIHITDQSGENSCQVTCIEEGVHDFDWSRSGEFVFTVRYSGLYKIKPDGSGLTSLSQDTGSGIPKWSPDGDKIVFRSSNGLSVVDADGQNLTTIASGHFRELVWSPDSSMIAAEHHLPDNAGSKIVILSPDGKIINDDLTTKFRNAYHPKWSPNGGKLTFSGTDDVCLGCLYIYNLDGSGLEKSIRTGESFWSPDGNLLFVSGSRERMLNTTNYQHETFLPDDCNVKDASWSPDSSKIALHCNKRGIFLYDINTETMTPIKEGNTFDPIWK